MAKANPIEIQKHLKGLDYPASKEEILQHAQQQGVEDQIYSLLEQLPDQQYEKPTDVNHEIGEIE